jgi:hypothetical protein
VLTPARTMNCPSNASIFLSLSMSVLELILILILISIVMFLRHIHHDVHGLIVRYITMVTCMK